MVSSRGFLTTSHTISVAINEAAISVDIVELDAVLRRWVIKLGFASILKKVRKTEMKIMCSAHRFGQYRVMSDLG